MKSMCVIAIALLASGAAAVDARQKPVPPADRAAAKRPATRADERPPLDRTRTAFIDDRSGGTSASTLRNQLRQAGLWTVTEQRGDADLVVTLAPASSPEKAGPRQAPSRYQLTVRSARSTSGAPLWQSVGKSSEELVKRLKAEVAPTFCFAVWCR